MKNYLMNIFRRLPGALDPIDRPEFFTRGLLFFAAFYLFFVVTWQLAVFQKMKRWPVAEGTLIQRGIVDSKDQSIQRYSGRFISYFVRESFEVPQRKDPVVVHDYSSTSRKKVERIFEERMKKVPVGSRVSLRLDPRHENQAAAVLSLSTALKERALKPALYTLILFGVWFLCWTYRSV